MFNFKKIWSVIRTISGDDAYDIYLNHYQSCEKHQKKEPLSRQQYYLKKLEEKWSGINRCC